MEKAFDQFTFRGCDLVIALNHKPEQENGFYCLTVEDHKQIELENLTREHLLIVYDMLRAAMEYVEEAIEAEAAVQKLINDSDEGKD